MKYFITIPAVLILFSFIVLIGGFAYLWRFRKSDYQKTIFSIGKKTGFTKFINNSFN